VWEQYPEIRDRLEKVELVIEQNLKSKVKPMEELLYALSNAGGKRLRPAFVILSSGFGNNGDDNILNAAAGIEILHMATLIHDDIIDGADVRRGHPTINHLHGDKMAVYMGDYLLTRAVMLLSRAMPEERMERLTRGIKSICEAEVEQFYSRFHYEISLVTYLKRIGRKTAMMFSYSCGEGAFLSKTPYEYARILAKFGFYYGMAFQIQDDITNLTRDSAETGKPKGNDIQEGVITLPFILAMRNSSDLKECVKQMFLEGKPEHKDIMWITREILHAGGIDGARTWIERYRQKAKSMLMSLPNRREKEILAALTEQIGP
jgi:heptaprenyl diphosphate synthase